MAHLIITIDGPAGSGKSTMARLLADRLGATFLDTGAMYRAVTLAAMQAGVDMTDEDQLLDVLDSRKFKFTAQKDKMSASIDGVDVTDLIREPEVTASAWHIASSPRMRAKLVEMQRQFADGEEKIVTEGRDQGTVAFSEANVKFYLIADAAERARRRQAELKAKGNSESLEQIQKAIEKRDETDRGRAVGPLKPASDAIVVDTTDLSIEEAVGKLLSFVKQK